MQSLFPTLDSRPRIGGWLLASALLSLMAWTTIAASSLPAQNDRTRQEVDLIAELLDLGAGDQIADVGADDGRYAVLLAARVGSRGRIYASEITDRQVEKIGRAAQDADLDNVLAIRATDTESGLPAGCCDAAMLRLVFHHLAAPERQLAQIRAALQPGGRLLIIENRPQRGRNAPGVPSNRSGMGIARDIVLEEITAAGFELVRELDEWPSGRYGGHYALLFRKPEA